MEAFPSRVEFCRDHDLILEAMGRTRKTMTPEDERMLAIHLEELHCLLLPYAESNSRRALLLHQFLVAIQCGQNPVLAFYGPPVAEKSLPGNGNKRTPIVIALESHSGIIARLHHFLNGLVP